MPRKQIICSYTQKEIKDLIFQVVRHHYFHPMMTKMDLVQSECVETRKLKAELRDFMRDVRAALKEEMGRNV